MTRYDIVIFGFAGYTGKYVFEKVYRQSKKEKLTFAVAGRNANKIRVGLEDSAAHLEDEEIKRTPIIIADSDDEHSLAEMAKQALVLLNCVGPSRLYGELVVKACKENGTHHLDIIQEPQAEQKNNVVKQDDHQYRTTLVPSCGFESSTGGLVRHWNFYYKPGSSVDYRSLVKDKDEQIRELELTIAITELVCSQRIKVIDQELEKEKLIFEQELEQLKQKYDARHEQLQRLLAQATDPLSVIPLLMECLSDPNSTTSSDGEEEMVQSRIADSSSCTASNPDVGLDNHKPSESDL